MSAGDLTHRWPLAEFELRDWLVTQYAAPQRKYHNLQHLREVFGNLDVLANHGVRWSALPVTLAAWFHDCVYDGQPDAEERSAQVAEAQLTQLDYPQPEIAEVARLVRLTASHRPTQDDQNGAALCDADLAILATPQPRYQQYSAAVRQEYAHYSDADFRAGRARVLETLLAAPSVFNTQAAHTLWQERAVSNMQHELAQLGFS
jgi:predicted metal-dependent HD superfamily phosphohydrolase